MAEVTQVTRQPVAPITIKGRQRRKVVERPDIPRKGWARCKAEVDGRERGKAPKGSKMASDSLREREVHFFNICQILEGSQVHAPLGASKFDAGNEAREFTARFP